jgi:hypothetical protein
MRREAWFEGQLDLDPGRLVFIDETWTSTNMARLRGRAPKGERLRGLSRFRFLGCMLRGAVRNQLQKCLHTSTCGL